MFQCIPTTHWSWLSFTTLSHCRKRAVKPLFYSPTIIFMTSIIPSPSCQTDGSICHKYHMSRASYVWSVACGRLSEMLQLAPAAGRLFLLFRLVLFDKDSCWWWCIYARNLSYAWMPRFRCYVYALYVALFKSEMLHTFHYDNHTINKFWILSYCCLRRFSNSLFINWNFFIHFQAYL